MTLNSDNAKLTDEQVLLIWSQDNIEEALRIAREIAEGRWQQMREELIET